MKKLRRQLLCFLTGLFLWPCIGLGQGSQAGEAGAGIQREGVSEAQRRFEAARASGEKRRREYSLRSNIVGAFVKWEQSRKSSDAAELDAILASIMDIDELGPVPFFYGAQLAYVRGNTHLAISLLNQAIHLYADEKAPETILPVKVHGRLWIANMQRQTGDGGGAIETYEMLRKQLDLQKPDQTLALAISWLNTAQIAAERSSDADFFNKATDSLLAITEAPDEGAKDCLDFFQRWALYQRTKKAEGKRAAATAMAAPRSISPFIGFGYLNVNGMDPSYRFPEEQQTLIWKLLMAKIDKMPAGDFDKGIMRWTRGCSYWMNKDYARSDIELKSLLDEDTFFSPLAGLMLAESHRQRQKDSDADTLLSTIAAKYPGYAEAVEKKRNEWRK